MKDRRIVGLISDTHGLLRREALDALQGSDFIIHAGDVGDSAVLRELAEIAPVTAVRGNVDKGSWADALARDEVLHIGEALIYVIHNIAELDLDPAAAGMHVVVCGHSHQPACRTKDGVLYVNPGSAGPRRFSLPVSMGRLSVQNSDVSAELIELEHPAKLAYRGAIPDRGPR